MVGLLDGALLAGLFAFGQDCGQKQRFQVTLPCQQRSESEPFSQSQLSRFAISQSRLRLSHCPCLRSCWHG